MSGLGSSNLLTLRPLPLSERRAVGGPVSRNLLATYFAVALVCWVAGTVMAIIAARDLAAGRPLASAPVLAVHRLALGVLPFAGRASRYGAQWTATLWRHSELA